MITLEMSICIASRKDERCLFKQMVYLLLVQLFACCHNDLRAKVTCTVENISNPVDEILKLLHNLAVIPIVINSVQRFEVVRSSW